MKRIAQRALLACVMAAAVFFWYSTQVNAQGTSQEQRVAKLRDEIGSVPTTAANYNEHKSTHEDWANDLASRKRLLVAQDPRRLGPVDQRRRTVRLGGIRLERMVSASFKTPH